MTFLRPFHSDMYHFDHFLGKSLSAFGDLVDMRGFEIHPAELRSDGRTNVRVTVESKVGKKIEFTFIMVLRTFSKYEGCWQTHRLLRSDSPYIDQC